LAPSLQSTAVMNRPQLLASLAAALVLGAAPAAFAQPTEVAASATTTRVDRRWSLAGVSNLTNGFAMFGVAAQYQLSDRFSVGGQLTLGFLTADAGAGGRVFLTAEPTSGLYLDLAAHAVAVMADGALGGVAELGYQHRGRSGFLFEGGVGLGVFHSDPGKCGCRPPGLEEDPWHSVAQLSMRFGYAF